MEKETWALIGAASAVAVPLVVNTVKETVFEHIRNKRDRNYIVVQVIFLLDKYIAECEVLSRNEGIFSAETQQVEMTYIHPKLNLSAVKGDYKYLSVDMLYRLHSIETKHAQIRHELSNLDDDYYYDAPEFTAYYNFRKQLYTQHGLYVAKLSEDICHKFRIDHVSWQDGFDPVASLRARFRQMRRSASEAAIRKKERRAKRKAAENSQAK